MIESSENAPSDRSIVANMCDITGNHQTERKKKKTQWIAESRRFVMLNTVCSVHSISYTGTGSADEERREERRGRRCAGALLHRDDDL
jgi:hypothetical protein